MTRLSALLALAALTLAAAPIPGFRAPAIPLITSDPFIQDWMFGDNATSDVARYWDSTMRQLTGIVRVDGVPFNFLGSVIMNDPPTTTILAVSFPNTDVDPGNCDLASDSSKNEAQCNIFCQATAGCRSYVMNGGTCYLKSCVEPRVQKSGVTSHVVVSVPRVTVDADIPGCDVSSKQGSSQMECAALCHQTQKCAAYTLVAGTCYLKSCTTTAKKAGAIAYVPTFATQSVAEGNVATYHLDKTDLAPGNCDIANKEVSSSDACNRWCQSVPSCRAYVVTGDVCYLKSCTSPAKASSDHAADIVLTESATIANAAVSGCVITSTAGSDELQCSKACHATSECRAFDVTASGKCTLRSCSSPTSSESGTTTYIPSFATSATDASGGVAVQKSVVVHPTRTVFEFSVPGTDVTMTLTLLSTLFTDDWHRLSRPVSYINVDVASGKPHTVELYIDAGAMHAVNSDSEKVTWDTYAQGGLVGAKVGTTAQKYVELHGDRVGINWGYLHLAGAEGAATTVTVGSGSQVRSSFQATGSLPPVDARKPRAVNDGYPVLAVAHSLGKVSGKASFTFMFAYDDVYSVYYYGQKLQAYYLQKWATFDAALVAAAGEYAEMLAKSEQHDTELMQKLAAVGGDKYATLGALTYRQTLAATKMTWNPQANEPYNFLKEISTNGDMQTMDVIYPASPMLLYADARLLERLLVPVLKFANNETSKKFWDPYSPHQIGVYPVADASTGDQEPMPMENTGNMFLMLLGIVQRTNDPSFFYPHFWPLLAGWADYLSSTLPCPAEQLCTDDFTGPLANNSNLALKGIVALEAFAKLCDTVKADASDCARWHRDAERFAKDWVSLAEAKTPTRHFKIAYDQAESSYSIKYNLLWQKMLKLDGPFDWKDVAGSEIEFYKKRINKYGVPMDMRHTYVKLDWLSWIAAIADSDADFHAFMDPIYDFANASPSRWPLTDLYDTISGVNAMGGASFVCRPVNGGIYAKMLV